MSGKKSKSLSMTHQMTNLDKSNQIIIVNSIHNFILSNERLSVVMSNDVIHEITFTSNEYFSSSIYA